MSVTIVGKAEPAVWYVYPNGGVFSFHVASYEDGRVVVFRADRFTWPSSILEDELSNYKLIRNATNTEVEEWHNENGENFEQAARMEVGL